MRDAWRHGRLKWIRHILKLRYFLNLHYNVFPKLLLQHMLHVRKEVHRLKKKSFIKKRTINSWLIKINSINKILVLFRAKVDAV